MQVYDEEIKSNRGIQKGLRHRHKIMILRDVLKAIQRKGCGCTITEIVRNVHISNGNAKRILFALLENELIVDQRARKIYEQGKGTIKNYYYMVEKGTDILLKLDETFLMFKELEKGYMNFDL